MPPMYVCKLRVCTGCFSLRIPDRLTAFLFLSRFNTRFVRKVLLEFRSMLFVKHTARFDLQEVEIMPA